MLINVIFILVLMELLINFGFLVRVCIKADTMSKDRKTFVLGPLKDVIKKWFTNRNIFGVVMSSIITLITIPGMLTLVLLELILWFIGVIVAIWELGTRE